VTRDPFALVKYVLEESHEVVDKISDNIVTYTVARVHLRQLRHLMFTPCDEHVCLSVCMSVREHISGTTLYLCARSSGVATVLVLPVLRMTSCLQYFAHTVKAGYRRREVYRK